VDSYGHILIEINSLRVSDPRKLIVRQREPVLSSICIAVAPLNTTEPFAANNIGRCSGKQNSPDGACVHRRRIFVQVGVACAWWDGHISRDTIGAWG
jgi:hypothetical protein